MNPTEQSRLATDLAVRLIEGIPESTPTEVAAIAALTLVRYVAGQDAALAPRMGAVLAHIAHELATGQLFPRAHH